MALQDLCTISLLKTSLNEHMCNSKNMLFSKQLGTFETYSTNSSAHITAKQLFHSLFQIFT